ncbi:MAG: MBL fold metallo-hydrolase [Betaproteobacteria bacterium]|nr:MBL fold metallo-hydrolase [Betaproteobacteria bacterium]
MDSQLPSFIEPLGGGVYAIDTGFHRPRFDAAYLIVQHGHAAFVDTGTNHSVPRLLQALQALGLERQAVDHVIPTHVHLDHAGGVGLLMAELPHATALVHERGARHMVDPTALYTGATAVYGAEEMERSYGRLVPVPAERVQATHDELVMDWHGRHLRFIDTPGHARHHHCLWDAGTRGWFTGDTFGLSYRVFDTPCGAWVMPTTTPVQFEPNALKQSIARLIESDPQCMYLTHYSRVEQPRVHARRLLRLIDEMVAIGQQHAQEPVGQRHQSYKAALRECLLQDLQQHGVDEALIRGGIADDWLSLDVELNAQGLAIWIDKQVSSSAQG